MRFDFLCDDNTATIGGVGTCSIDGTVALALALAAAISLDDENDDGKNVKGGRNGDGGGGGTTDVELCRPAIPTRRESIDIVGGNVHRCTTSAASSASSSRSCVRSSAESCTNLRDCTASGGPRGADAHIESRR